MAISRSHRSSKSTSVAHRRPVYFADGVLIAICVFTLISTVFVRFTPPPTVNGQEFFSYLERADRSDVARDLVRISPDPIRPLMIAVQSRATHWDRLYSRIWKELPQGIKRTLRSPYRSESIQATALHALGCYGPDAVEAIPAILEIAKDQKAFNKAFAMNAALLIAPNDARVNATFHELLQTPNLRRAAANAIYNTHNYPKGIRSSLLPLDWSNPSRPPYNGLLAVHVLGSEASSEIPKIIEALEHPAAWGLAEGNLLNALLNMGEAATNSIPTLRKRLVPTYQVSHQLHSLRILAGMGPSALEAIPFIEPVLASEHSNVKAVAAYACAKISGLDERAVRTLSDAFENPVGPKLSWTCEVSRQYGLGGINLNHLQTLAWILSELAPDPQLDAVVPMVKANLREGNRPWLTGLLARFLWRQTKQSEEPITHLIATLSTANDPHETVLACHFLGEMGSVAVSTIPSLQEVCRRDLFSRLAAWTAIEKIEGSETLSAP